MAEEFLTSGQVARLLGISPRTARRYLTKGLIPAEQNRLTGRWRVSKAALTWFMKKHNLTPIPFEEPRRQTLSDSSDAEAAGHAAGGNGRQPATAWGVAEFGLAIASHKSID